MMHATPMTILSMSVTLAVHVLGAGDPLLGGAFKVCSRSDPQLERCVLDSVNGARSKLLPGVPELNLPPLNPLHGNSMVVSGTQDLPFHISLTNWSWNGITDFLATRARVEFSPPYVELDLTFKEMYFTTQCQFAGSILALRLNVKGDSEFIWGANVTLRINLGEETHKGKKYWKVKNCKWDMKPVSFRCKFRNLFQGKTRMDAYVNEFINSEWETAFAEYGHLFNGVLADTVKSLILDKVLKKVSLNQLFAS